MMNNEDICKARFELKLEAAENELRRQTMAEIEGEKHRNNLLQENDRHHEELRRINDEARVAAQDIMRRRMALNIEEAKLKDLANKTNTGNE